MNPRVELKKPGSQAGRLAQGTSPRGPHTCHPQHTGRSYTPDPQGWSVGSHTLTLTHSHAHTHTHIHPHTHSHTHTHTLTLTHTNTHTVLTIHQRASEAQTQERNFYQSVRKFASTGRTGQSREKKKPMGYLLIHPGSHVVRRFGEALRQGLRCWLPQTRPL